MTRRRTATSSPSCWRQVFENEMDAHCERHFYIVHLCLLNQFHLTVCLLAVYKLDFICAPPNLIWFVSPDDGGHSVRLHHDLQAAQWSFSWAASQQQLHTGGAREYNKRWMWISILVVYKTVLLYQHEFCRSIMILRHPFMIHTFMFCVRCGPLKTYRPTSSSLIGSTCTSSEGKQKKYDLVW